MRLHGWFLLSLRAPQVRGNPFLAQRQDSLAVLSVQDLTHSAVDSRQTAENSFKSSNSSNGMITGEVTDSQQQKQNGQAAENNLSSTIVLKSTNIHKCGEDTPQQ